MYGMKLIRKHNPYVNIVLINFISRVAKVIFFLKVPNFYRMQGYNYLFAVV